MSTHGPNAEHSIVHFTSILVTLVCDGKGGLQQLKLQVGVHLVLWPSLKSYFEYHCIHVHASHNSTLHYMEDVGKMISLARIARTHCHVEWHMRYLREVCQVLQQPNFGCLYGGGRIHLAHICAKVCRQDIEQDWSFELYLCLWLFFCHICVWCFLCTRVCLDLFMCVSRLPE